MNEILNVFFLFFVAHVFADIVFQSEYMSYMKRIHEKSTGVWPYFLFGHGAIHGFGVMLVTQNIHLGMAEMVLHSAIDFGKGKGLYNTHIDQLLHAACKMGYIIWIGAKL